MKRADPAPRPERAVVVRHALPRADPAALDEPDGVDEPSEDVEESS